MISISTLLCLNSASSTKEQIISVLSNEFPLTAKSLFNHVNKANGGVSYQAVHKALQELEAIKIVEKGSNGYLLSVKWMDASQAMLDSLRAKYFPFSGDLPTKSNLVFESIAELDAFLIKVFLKLLHSRNDKPVLCLQWSHFWLPLFEKEDYLHSRELGKFSKAYCLSMGDTPIDRWCSEFWDKNQMKTKTGCDIATTSDVIVFEDIVIEVFYPPEIRKMLDEVYNNTKKVGELNVDDFFEKVFQKKTKIPVIITKNKLVADQLREQTLAFFR